MESLARRGIRAELSLAGAGQDEPRLRKLAADLGVSQRVLWLRDVTDVERLYSEADVSLLCSDAEPLGRVTIESTAAGCPLVAAGNSGTLEIVSDGDTGLLYEYGDPVGLANAIVRLVEDRGHRERLRRAAHQ